MLKKVFCAAMCLAMLFVMGGCGHDDCDSDEFDPGLIMCDKPVIYLYPEETMNVHVGLSFAGELAATYPEYPENGWDVTAEPDGTLHIGERTYPYLFWEGRGGVTLDFSSGFIVRSEDALGFLEGKLLEIGLTEPEANEMIVYWLPILEANPYNLISFQGAAYTDKAVLDIDPMPDSVLRVFMAVKALDGPVDIPGQTFRPFVRDGFTVVEWGGCVVN